MNIPNLPTDTLYKFITVGGLIGVIYFSSRMYISFSEINKKYNKEFEFNLNYALDTFSINYQLKINNERIFKLKSYMKRYEFSNLESTINVDEVIKSFKDIEKRELYKFIFDYKEEVLPYYKYKTLKDELEKENDKLYKELKRLEISKVIVFNENYKVSNVLEIIVTALLDVLFGILMFGGFYYWYIRQLISDHKDDMEVTK